MELRTVIGTAGLILMGLMWFAHWRDKREAEQRWLRRENWDRNQEGGQNGTGTA